MARYKFLLPAGCRKAANCRYFLFYFLFCICVCVCVLFYSTAFYANKTSVLNLLTGQKSGFSPRRGDSLHRFMSNLAGPTGTSFRLAVQNLSSIATGVGMQSPKNIKNFHFSVKSRLAPLGRTHWLISKFLGTFYTPDNPTLVFQISCDSHRRLWSYCWETARR